MAKEPSKKTTDSGLELDRINLSSISSGGSRKPMRVEGPGVGAADPPSASTSENSQRGKKNFNLTLITALAVLALLMALTAIFFKKQNLSFTFLSGKSNAPLENYLRVGPVTATLANDDIVKFSVDIDCGNSDLKEQLAGKDPQIRDKIVAVLTEPGTEELIKNREYETIKARIKENLGDLGPGPIGDIYFAELLMY